MDGKGYKLPRLNMGTHEQFDLSDVGEVRVMAALIFMGLGKDSGGGSWTTCAKARNTVRLRDVQSLMPCSYSASRRGVGLNGRSG